MGILIEKWKTIGAVVLAIFASLVYAGEEWSQYKTMKEAVREQKRFNTDFSSKVYTMESTQQRIDERTLIILEMVKELKDANK